MTHPHDTSPVSVIPEGLIAYCRQCDQLVLQPMDPHHPPQEIEIPTGAMDDFLFTIEPKADNSVYFRIGPDCRGRHVQLPAADACLENSLIARTRWLISGEFLRMGSGISPSYVLEASDADVMLDVPVWAHYAGLRFDTNRDDERVIRDALYYDRKKVFGGAQSLPPFIDEIAMFNKMSKQFQLCPREDRTGFKRIVSHPLLA